MPIPITSVAVVRMMLEAVAGSAPKRRSNRGTSTRHAADHTAQDHRYQHNNAQHYGLGIPLGRLCRPTFPDPQLHPPALHEAQDRFLQN